MLYNKPLK